MYAAPLSSAVQTRGTTAGHHHGAAVLVERPAHVARIGQSESPRLIHRLRYTDPGTAHDANPPGRRGQAKGRLIEPAAIERVGNGQRLPEPSGPRAQQPRI